MARGVNKAILIGNLGNDPEVKRTTNNDAVATISLATSETWKDKQSNEKQERTEWHRVVFFKRLAEIAGEYLRKGSKIYVEGTIRTRKWADKNGVDRYTTEIIANEMQMLDRKSESNTPPPESVEGYMSYPEVSSKTSAPDAVDAKIDDKKPVYDDVPF